MRQFAVIGCGRFGSGVLETLYTNGRQVLAIDVDEEIIQQVSEYATNAVTVDATDEKALRAVGIENVDCAIVGIGTNLEASIIITLTLKQIGVKEIIAKAVTPNHGMVLKMVGANKVIFPERDMGVRVANSLISSRIVDQIDISDEYGLVEITTPKDFFGKSLSQLDIRAKYGLNVIAIKKKPEQEGQEPQTDIAPHANTVVSSGDTLVVIGTSESIEKMKGKL
ncbi:MAG: hypothetical protein AUJ75_03490 [Candidatus Omnitrophica bacterium CG1_02_49_10]|nr:MAG: hypothetical protein AUJ75_03490 [Candidatus Omnitrophica bacterium CG1_02_49_10]